MAKIKSRYLLLSIFAFLILCGCSIYQFVLPQPSPPKPTIPPPDWFTEWLTNPVCQSPCWEGITPGITTITETVKILQGIPWVRIEEGPERPFPNKGHITLEWRFASPSSGGGRVIAFDDGRINTLNVVDDLSTQIQNVFDRYGVPDKVFIDSCNDGLCSTKLIYMKSGMAVELFLDWDRDAGGDITITPKSAIRGIEFFTPGEKGYLTAYPQYSQSFPKWSSPWVGYSKYSFR